MTIIIGVETVTGTALVADKRLTTSGLGFPSKPKIFRVGDILYGIAGAGSMVSKIRYRCKLPSKFVATEDQEQWVYSEVIPTIEDLEDESDSVWELIIATKSEVIVMDDSFDITRSENGYYAIGSGAKYAFGVLAYIKSKGNMLGPEDAADAVRIASMCDVSCGDGIDMLTNVVAC